MTDDRHTILVSEGRRDRAEGDDGVAGSGDSAGEEPAPPGRDAPDSTGFGRPAPWPAPSRRILDRPPSDRYDGEGSDPATGDAEAAGMPAGPRWAIGIGVFAAVIPAGILVVMAWLFGFTSGLVVAAIFLGRIVGLSVRGAPKSGLTSDARTLVAIVITLASLGVSQVAIWLLALREGGVLPIVDYLAQTYGPVVPLEAMLGTIAAWWSAK